MSQMTQTQNDGGRYREEDINNKARDLVRFFLSSTGRKLPIKRQEIIEKIMKDMSRAFNVTLERAQRTMEDTYGLRIVVLEQPNKTFCVVNSLDIEQEEYVHLEWPHADNQQAALLMMVLSIIYMSGEVTQCEDMWKALQKIGLNYEKSDHEVFGDVKKLITQEFVQQGYLVYKRLPETDPPKFEFSWGQRAVEMTSKEDVLSFVCQIFDDMNMYDWPQQYDAIHGEGAAAERKREALEEAQEDDDQMEDDE